MQQLNWIHCEGGYCDLSNLNLNHQHFDDCDGVYVIWRSGTNPKTVRLGQGIIKERVGKHRNDPLILRHKGDGNLHVTWAKIPPSKIRDGIERYLAEQLQPLVGDAFPQQNPIAVNLPW